MHTYLRPRGIPRLAPSLTNRRDSRRHALHLYKHNRTISSVPHSKTADIESFRQHAYIPETPLVLKASHITAPVKQWFTHGNEPSACLSSQLTQHSSSFFPYEFVQISAPSGADPILGFLDWLRARDEDLACQLANAVIHGQQSPTEQQTVFHQISAPLGLLEMALEYNKLQPSDNRVKRLYIAQSQLNELPGALRDDLPLPDIVMHAGKGDVYDSSLWLGLEPTYTPLHRDPNPNLFVQLLSSKTVRLLTPVLGQQLYAQIQSQLGSRGNSRFRGPEMMQGPERAALYDAIWGSGPSANIYEAILEAGDALFIPKGWWHSVQSRFDDGRLNASVNWWFR